MSIHSKGYGKADAQQPITPQTQFPIAALQLVEAGKINLDVLDVSVKQYLPDFTLADTQTADQITNHCEV